MVIQGSINVDMLIGIIIGAVVPTLVVVLQNIAERKRQVRDHQHALADFRAQLLIQDLDVITDTLDQMTEFLRVLYGRRIGEISDWKDIKQGVVTVRGTLARASWRTWSFESEIRDLTDKVITTGQQILDSVVDKNRKHFNRGQVDALINQFDEQAGAVRTALREYLARVRAGEVD